MKTENRDSFVVTDGAEIRLNASKSLLIRELAARYIYRDELLPVLPSDSEDVKVMHRCLELVHASRDVNDLVTVDADNCGAAYRFLMALLAVTEGEWLLTGTPRLLARPMEPLADALRCIGASVAPATEGWRISGRMLHAEQLVVDCTLSSQFASALLLIGPKIGLKRLTTIPDIPPSAPYLAMTRHVLNNVRAGFPPLREADWSTAVFWYAFVLLSPRVNTLLLRDLRLDSVQGDSAVNRIFCELGVASEQTADGVIIRKSHIPTPSELFLDLSHNPDLAPVLAVTATMLPVSLVMSGLDNLNHKESRRLDVLVQVLSRLASVETKDGGTLRVHGRSIPVDSICQPLVLDTHADHRMVMAFALLSFKYDVYLTDTECVAKSYPEFQIYFSPHKRFEK